MVVEDTASKEAPLLSGAQTINSIRDTGYKGADYALAELIDNSFQWGEATTVMLIIVQRTVQGKHRATKRVGEIWVIDDGKGMTEEALNLALSFGGSGKYDDRSGIGRFGMGLPQASVSQCRRTDVWTWQMSQPENAIHTYLDLDKIQSAKKSGLTVPWPSQPADPTYVSMPEWARDAFKDRAVPDMSKGQPLYSGTAVRWTDLDRLRWVRAETVVTHTEYLLGRIYRNFLTAANRPRTIRVVVMDEGTSIENPALSRDVRPNDPLYLLPAAETTLEYWEAAAKDDQTPLVRITEEAPFVEYDAATRDFAIRRLDGKGTSTVRARFSRALTKARPGSFAGRDTHQGRNAGDNSGISVMRAGRELLLEKTLAQGATDRWWGVEIAFNPELDEIFGVTNNKQETPNFTQALRLARDGKPKAEALNDGLFHEEHPIAELYDMAYQLVKLVGSMRTLSKVEQKGAIRARGKQPDVTSTASDLKKKRAPVSPTPGEAEFEGSDRDPDKAVAAIEKKLEESDVSDIVRDAIIANYKRDVTVQVVERGERQASAFFWPDEALNLEILWLNSAHPAYAALIEPLRISNEDIQRMTEGDAKALLMQCADTMTWMLLAWSRYENEHRTSPILGKIQEIREGWGRRLGEYVKDPDFIAASLFGEEDDSQGGDEER